MGSYCTSMGASDWDGDGDGDGVVQPVMKTKNGKRKSCGCVLAMMSVRWLFSLSKIRYSMCL